MPNKSRLNAEMKKQLEDWWMDNDPLDFGQLSAFLATALEEQRLRYIKQVEKLPVSKLSIYQVIDVRDVFTILNGKEV